MRLRRDRHMSHSKLVCKMNQILGARMRTQHEDHVYILELDELLGTTRAGM